MKKAISYLFIFMGIQLLSGAVMAAAWNLFAHSTEESALKLIATSAVAGIVTIVAFLATRWAEVSPAWLRTRPWTVLIWSVIASLGAIIPSAWLQEQLPELPNIVEQEFDLILKDRWGYVVIGLLASLSEEVVFRGAILRSLLRSSRLSVGGAIALSALMFSVIHLNPAQLPHTFIIGLLLGWMYYRTGSILPGVAYHWANNSVAYVLYNLYPDPDMKLIDLFGTDSRVLMAVGFSLLILLPALYQLHLNMRRAS